MSTDASNGRCYAGAMVMGPRLGGTLFALSVLLLDVPIRAADRPAVPASAPAASVEGAAAQAMPDPAAADTPCGPAVADMACIPGGTFLRGRDDGPEAERPAATIQVDSFYMDLYEVTFPQYQACVKAGACRKAKPHYKGFSGPRQPMVGLPWYGADEYCRSRGKRLPTEAEWEKAARGADGRRYPWGNERATCERAIIKDAAVNGCRRGTTWDIGSRPAGVYGLFDMAGNAWEWVADWYSPSYAACGPDCAGANPKGPCGGAEPCPGRRYRVVRGGSWFWNLTYATTTWRRRHLPANEPYYHHFGFRCAKDAQTSPAPAKPQPAEEGNQP